MRPLIYGLAVVVSVVSGLLLGVFVPFEDHPAGGYGQRYTQWTFPPPTGWDANSDGAIWDYISCGWHNDCSYINFGRAIDFHKNGAEGQIDTVWFRTWAIVLNPNNPGLQRVGYGYSYDEEATNPGICYQTFTQLRDINNNPQGYLRHVHTNNASWSTVSVWAQQSGWFYNSYYAAMMVYSEKPTCSWGGVHVHETVAWDVPFTHRDNDCTPPNYYPCYDVPDNQYRYNALDPGSWHRWIDWNY